MHNKLSLLNSVVPASFLQYINIIKDVIEGTLATNASNNNIIYQYDEATQTNGHGESSDVTIPLICMGVILFVAIIALLFRIKYYNIKMEREYKEQINSVAEQNKALLSNYQDNYWNVV